MTPRTIFFKSWRARMALNSSEGNASAARKNLIEGAMRIYNALGYSALGLQLVLSAWLAPPSLGPWWCMAVGFWYLVMSWFLAGVYLSDVMHMGITHGALDYKEWFIKSVTLVNNTVAVYVDPISW